MSQNNHDEMLFEMLKECKTLPKFLDNVFGFLQRRTDFYHVAKEENSPIGLPDGLAEKLVRHTFYKFKPNVSDKIVNKENSNDKIINKEDSSVGKELVKVKSICNKPVNDTFYKSDCYNGGEYENYCWSQTISEVDVIIKLPKDCIAKNIKVTINPSNINVKCNNEDLLNGDLCKKCKSNDAIWSIDGQKLLIHLDKCQEIWWNYLIKGEPEIDVSKIDCSRPYEELPEEAQSKIEELQWNQERKRLGLPTSEEIAMQETLKKAWHAEGSPFTGPFDPTCVKFN